LSGSIRLSADEVTKLKAERLPGMYPDVNFRSGSI
jgi:hypothetical protein